MRTCWRSLTHWQPRRFAAAIVDNPLALAAVSSVEPAD